MNRLSLSLFSFRTYPPTLSFTYVSAGSTGQMDRTTLDDCLRLAGPNAALGHRWTSILVLGSLAHLRHNDAMPSQWR